VLGRVPERLLRELRGPVTRIRITRATLTVTTTTTTTTGARTHIVTVTVTGTIITTPRLRRSACS